ncbi:ATP phosphoribosyltransferase regulatory subunit [Hydrogenovibrio halophilus]|uniref:ATP phosphoribosyltransferase regulatory subunit n=1 Tax=Hydrogenovibrio halophilus TaxID=373391 RepID=UPI00036856BD|nr:ATP phosphoribosyltransferase regulatory subunit [Hydrogenovibrio halophilus]
MKQETTAVSKQATWFTPEGIEDLLPDSARKLEHYRRQLLDLFEMSGYDLVLPPIAEFTDSLLTGKGEHLAVDTCRFTDQESGKMMGVRADMTPQVARIATNRLKDASVSRLCYVGEVLKTRNNKAKGSRSPIEVGAELFGHAGVASDIEVIELMLNALRSLTDQSVTLSLGHVSVVDTLMAEAGLDSDQKNEMVEILLRKALPEYEAFVSSLGLSGSWQRAFEQLPSLMGEAADVLTQADELAGFCPSLTSHFERLAAVVTHFEAVPGVQLHMDLSDLRGYQYHTGLIFTAYLARQKLIPIARGGRYDDIGSVFGACKPATGFSLDLRSALDWLPEPTSLTRPVVYAPLASDPALTQAVDELRADGVVVKRFYEASDLPAEAEQLVCEAGKWQRSA